MTVAELIRELQTLPLTAIVTLSRDAEGNGYELACNISLGRYNVNDRQWGLAELTDEDKKQGYSEEDVIDGPLAVCIFPTR